jgi:hypothetical protein
LSASRVLSGHSPVGSAHDPTRQTFGHSNADRGTEEVEPYVGVDVLPEEPGFDAACEDGSHGCFSKNHSLADITETVGVSRATRYRNLHPRME